MAINNIKNLPQNRNGSQMGCVRRANCQKQSARNKLRLRWQVYLRLQGADTTKRPHGEKAFPAGIAAISRKLHGAKYSHIPSVDMPGGDALKIEIAAVPAVHQRHEQHGDGVRVETLAAVRAAPRAQPHHADDNVLHTAALRAAAALTDTSGTKHHFLPARAPLSRSPRTMSKAKARIREVRNGCKGAGGTGCSGNGVVL